MGGHSRIKIEEEMTRFMVKLKLSGYGREMRWEILKSGTVRYNRMLREDREGRRSLNRPRWEGGHGRYWGKLMKKGNWYKRGPLFKTASNDRDTCNVIDKAEKEIEKMRSPDNEEEAETVLFVPCTPRGELLKLMRETDRKFREGTSIRKFKFVERRGKSLQDLLVSGNPWSDQKCGREKCVICRRETGNLGECTRENALYRITCIECK